MFLQLLYLVCACINDFSAFSQRLGPKFVQNCVPAKMMARHGKWLKSKNPAPTVSVRLESEENLLALAKWEIRWELFGAPTV